MVGGDQAIACYRKELQDSDKPKSQYIEGVVSLNLKDGQANWRYEYEVSDLEKQQSFSGDPRSPQATPVVYEGNVIVLGFTGELCCLKLKTGELVWKKDLVRNPEIKAKPVQFGFSASPMMVGGRLVVYCGGESKGLLCLNPEDGKEIWSCDCGEASYATPVSVTLEAVPQLVMFSRNEVLGVQQSDGEILWRHPLIEKGLTNVPFPLRVAGGRFLISGQGAKGIFGIEVSRKDGQWNVEESFRRNGPQLFYTNWVTNESKSQMFGCTDKLLNCVDAKDGNRRGRWRGFGDGNLIRIGDQLLCVSGDGTINFLQIEKNRLLHLFKYSPFKKRVWAMPTLVGNRLLLRAENNVYCFELKNEKGKTNNRLAEPEELDFR